MDGQRDLKLNLSEIDRRAKQRGGFLGMQVAASQIQHAQECRLETTSPSGSGLADLLSPY